MLGVLRSGGGERREHAAESMPLAAVGVAAAAAASRAADDEGPCLAEIEDLVGQSAAAGMVVESDGGG
ncbi:histidine kinase OS=Streptomyces violarus OX=67380 GN=FHS41_006824 PE=4 SV=1 [Streptomyces violarus]